MIELAFMNHDKTLAVKRRQSLFWWTRRKS